MKYAVIRLMGHQYKVSEGEEILVDKMDEKKAKIETLLLVDEGKIKIGEPVLEKVKLKFKILGEEKGKKIQVQKYKAKSRYRKKIGFRPQFTRVLIEKIG